MVISKFNGDFDFLSNFFSSPIRYEGMVYPTVEHAFQAAKTMDMAKRREIAGLPTPGAAKRAGRQVTLRPDWEEVKVDIMETLLREKFSNPHLNFCLRITDGHFLEEGNNWHDNFWGVCHCERCGGNGRNQLGKLLMKIRAEAIEEKRKENEN